MRSLPENHLTTEQRATLSAFRGCEIAIRSDGTFLGPDGFSGEVTQEQMNLIARDHGAGVYLIGSDPNQLPDRNPWARESFNLTEQGKLLRENPELAEGLTDAAL